MSNPTQLHVLTHDEVVAVVGELTDAKIVQIIATGATISELEEAVAFAGGENDVMGDLRRPATGAIGAVYDILTAEEEYEEEGGV